MNRLDRLEVYLENSRGGRFHAGDTVHGKLVVILRRSLKIQGIQMKVKGRGHAEWREAVDQEEERQLYETEEYLDESITVFGKEPDKDSPTHMEFMDSGEHVFHFRFDLPKHVPSSFEGTHGYIRYWVKAKIFGVWGLLDQSGKVEFGVERTLDLNVIPGACEPAEDEDSCVLCGCCLNSGAVTASFRINRRGFVPGESIICNAEIYNGSDISIKSTKIKFYKVTTYGDSPFESITREKQTIAEQFRGKIKSGRHEIYSNEQLSLPSSLPATSLPGCYFIDVDYVVELKVSSSQEELNMRIPLLIVVGTVPLNSSTPRDRHPIRDIVSQSSPIPEPVIYQPLSSNPLTSDFKASEAPPTVSAPPMATELDENYPPMEQFSIYERERTLNDLYSKHGRPRLFRVMTVVNEAVDLDDEEEAV